MFLRLPFESAISMQNLALILNTVLLVAILIAVELIYSEATAEKRKQLRYFLPLLLVIIGILIYAAYRQNGGG